jgi:tetratricopeptide (TPR) repeat protein
LTNNYIEQSLSISLRILEEVPAQTEALMILGEVYFKKQEYEKSIETFESFIKIIAPRVYLAKNKQEKLRAMKYISDSKCKLNRYIDGLRGYLKIMALEGRDYLLIREYVKVTDNLLNKHTKEIDARYLDSILYDIGNLKIIKEYADILCLNNDLRGEFIKHQNNMYDFSMQLDKPSDKKDLLEKVEHLWVEPNMRAEFKQGFPWEVMITDSEDIPYIERLPWVYTVRKLEIIELAYDNKQAICMIFEQNLPALRELKVQAEYFGYLCTKKLVEAPFFEKLESLILTQCNLDAPSLKLIIRNLPLHIKELRLLYCNAEDKLPVEDRVGDLFTLSDRLKELEVLDLTDCSLEKQDVEKILSSNLPCLKSLNLTGNNLMEFDVYEFLKFPLISNLEDLSVGETGLEKNLLWTILDDFKNFKIKKLGVRSDWKKEEMSDIKLHSNFEKLEKVDFGDIQAEEEDWMQFFN